MLLIRHPRRGTLLLLAMLTVLAIAGALLPACTREEAGGPASPPSPALDGAADPSQPVRSDPDTFTLRAFGAVSVYLAGSMNGWAINDPAWQLTPQGDGYTWQLVADLPEGLTQYKYVLYDGGPGQEWLTDPAAVEITPDGYHANPAYWNAVRGRTFTPPRPLPVPIDRERLVIYEISPNDFSATGTFAGIIAGLTSGPDLVDLGVNAIELMPVTAPSYNGWGYDIILHRCVNPNYGWPSTFASLVDAAHQQGIAVILDMVLNHAAGSCPLRQLDDFAGVYNFTTDEPNPWGLVELNYTNEALRAFILESLCFWVNTYKVDGFRFDYIGGEPYSTWEWLEDELRARYPDLLLIAEDFNYANPINAVIVGYDAQWGGNHTDGWGGGGNNFNQVMITALTENGFAWRGSTTPSVGAFGPAYRNMWAVANVIAANPQYAGGVPGDGFSDVKYLESHDENRVVWSVNTIGSAGAQAVGGLTKAYLGALVQTTCVGIPMLYNGVEIGAGEYRPANPTIQKIDWDTGDADLRAAYRNLIQLRLRHPALAGENTFFQWRDGLVDQEEMTMVYWRGETTIAADATIVVALNFDHLDHLLPVPFPAPGIWFRLHPVSGARERVSVPPEGLTLTLPASSGILWIREDGLTGVPD